MPKKAVWIALALTVAIVGSFLYWTPSASAFTSEQKLVLQSWRIINQSYLDESFNDQNWWFVRQKFIKKNLKNRDDAYDTIEEMLATLDEPFTRLLRPKQYNSLKISTSGELSGVGLQININPETKDLEVVTPIPGSPAEAAGIKPRDRILEIDGVDTTTISLDEAANRMRGKVGTKVNLLINSPGENARRSLDIVRDRISLNPVYARLDNRHDGAPIGYLRLSEFSANATKEIAHAIVDLDSQGAQGYILDLRNNPGGLLQAGIEIARLWIDDGTIVHTVNRQGVFGSFSASGKALTDEPLVVLVNQGTASASEILSGALQDNERALLVGEQTFGKGLIQSLFELPYGAGLAVTVAKYETPDHKDINKLGITPDKIVSQDPLPMGRIGQDEDLQYQAAVELITSSTAIAQAA